MEKIIGFIAQAIEAIAAYNAGSIVGWNGL